MFYVYIIKSISTNRYYIGHTANLEDRLTRHNENRSKATKGRGPWKLVITFPCQTKTQAYQLEMKLKSFKNTEKAISYLETLAQA